MTSTEKDSDEISLQELIEKIRNFLRYLKSKWLSLLIAAILGGGLGIGYYYIQSPKYTAECTFILEEKTTGSGGLSGLASQFGFDLGSLGGSSLFAGDNLLEIIPSKKIVQSVLLSKVDSTSNATLADLFLDFTKLKKAWANKERLANISFSKVQDPEKMSLIQDSVMNLIYNQVVKSYLKVSWLGKKTSIIKVTVTSKNGQFSKYLTERLVEQSRKLYIDIKTGTAQENVNRLQRRADSLYNLLNSKSYQAAENQVMNVNPAMKDALVKTEISSRDKTVIATIYAEVVKNLETSKILLSQQTPVIQVLDRPDFPLVDSKKHKKILLLIGVTVGVFLVLGVFFINFISSK